MQIDKDTLKLTEPGSLGKTAIVIGVVGLILSLLGLVMPATRQQFFQSYLTAFMFWLTIALGGLFATMVHHLARVTWSVVVRRVFESIAANLPWMALFFLPLAFGVHQLYAWASFDPDTADALLLHKRPYLNLPFFYIRAVLYFVIWFALSRLLLRFSLKQDETGDAKLTDQMRLVSGPGMVLFALTLTYAAFDWMMSLHYHWFSTMFGVYIFSGSFLSLIAFTTLIVMHFHRHGVLRDEITVEHYHDLGKWMFAFVVFWSYISFSQFFLIWYANVPEETEFFKHRWEGNWQSLSVLIVFGHFVLPFLILLSRVPKRSAKVLTLMGVWLLFIHWIDLFWVIGPTFMHGSFHFSWLDVTTTIGIGGIFVGLFWLRLTKHALLPVRDPRLQASINFINA